MSKHIDRDKIMTKDQFYKLSKVDRRALMAHWRQVYTTEEIKRQLNMSTTAFYALLKRLDLPTNLTAYRDNQPSLLGEKLSTTQQSTQNAVNMVEQSIEERNETITFGIEITGKIRQEDLDKVIDLARRNEGLEIRMKG